MSATAGADLLGVAQTYSRNGRLHFFVGWRGTGYGSAAGVYLEETSGDSDDLAALAFPGGGTAILICAYSRGDSDPLPILDIVTRKDGSLVVTVGSKTATVQYIVRNNVVYASTVTHAGGVYF